MHTVGDVIGGRSTFSVKKDWSVQEVVDYLCERGIGAVAVCEEGRVVGVFSERDLLHRVVNQKLDPAQVKVSEIMTSEIHSVTRDANHRVAKSKMMDNNVRHLVVLDEDERLAGFVSMRELIEMDLEEQRDLVTKLNDDYYQRAYKPGKQ